MIPSEFLGKVIGNVGVVEDVVVEDVLVVVVIVVVVVVVFD